MIKNLNIEHIKKEFKKIQNYFTTGNYEKVIEKTEILLKKDKQVPFYNLLGLSYRQIGQQENAEEIFKKGLKIFPNNISILSNIGAFYRNTGKFDDAENYLNKALSLNNSINLYGFNSNQIDGNNYNKVLDLFKKGVLIKDIIKPIYK